MDPWASCHLHVTDFDKKITKFEDNFITSVEDRLPDHQAYVAALESKLRKIKSNPNVLQQLISKKDGFMLQLLSDDLNCSHEQSFLDEPISKSQILRTLLPQKQALSQGEIVELIKYDQLSAEVDKDCIVTEVQENNSEECENRSP